MSWPEALAFIAAMGVVSWALWLRHRTVVKAMENGYEEESRYALPPVPGYQPLWIYGKPPTTPPPERPAPRTHTPA